MVISNFNVGFHYFTLNMFLISCFTFDNKCHKIQLTPVDRLVDTWMMEKQSGHLLTTLRPRCDPSLVKCSYVLFLSTYFIRLLPANSSDYTFTVPLSRSWSDILHMVYCVSHLNRIIWSFWAVFGTLFRNVKIKEKCHLESKSCSQWHLEEIRKSKKRVQ